MSKRHSLYLRMQSDIQAVSRARTAVLDAAKRFAKAPTFQQELLDAVAELERSEAAFQKSEEAFERG